MEEDYNIRIKNELENNDIVYLLRNNVPKRVIYSVGLNLINNFDK